MGESTEKPSAAPAPHEKSRVSPDKQALKTEFEVIEEKIQVLAGSLESPAFPPAFVSSTEADTKEQARLFSLFQKLSADPRGKVEESLGVLKKSVTQNPADAANKAKLILSMMLDYVTELERYRADSALLKVKAMNSATKLIDVPSAAFVTILAGPPRLPREEPKELTVWQNRLQTDWEELCARIALAMTQNAQTDIPALQKKIADYCDDVSQYEAACRTFGLERFKKEFGFPADMTDAEIQQFLADIVAPLPHPDTAKGENRTDSALQKSYSELERARSEMEQKLPLFLLHGFTDSLRGKMVNYIMKRDVYERRVLEKPSNVATWALYMGIAANELGEELLENSIGWPKTMFGLQAKDLSLFPPKTRLQIVNGWKEVSLKLAKKGVPVESLSSILGTLNKSPVGPKFWSELMAIESPATVLLWAYYMHSSDDKFKACVQFGSFIALSGASNKLLAIADGVFARMGIGMRIPGHPVVKLTFALLLAFLSASAIDQFSIWANTKLWPDSTFKHGVMTGLDLISVRGPVSQAYQILERGGALTLDPDQDTDSFLSRENVHVDYEALYDSTLGLAADTFVNDATSQPSRSEESVVNNSYFQTVKAWNTRVDIAIAAEKNPIRKKLWEEEKIEDPLLWGERMSVRLYAQVAALKGIENTLAMGLIKKGVIRVKADLNGLDIATRDDGVLRNDRELSNAFGTGTLSNIRVYMEGGLLVSRTIAEDHELVSLWNDYKSMLQPIAKSVSIYKHLGIYPPHIGRKQWLGEITGQALPPTAQVERGLVEEIAYRNRRQRAIASTTHSDLENRDYAEQVVDSVAYVEPQSFFQWLNLAESNAPEQEEDVAQLKRFVRLNAAYFHGRDLDRVLQPFAVRAATGQQATYEDLEGMYTRMSDFLLERSLKDTAIKPLPASVLQELRLNPRLAFEQRGVFGSGQKEMMMLLQQNKTFLHAMYGDCLVLRSTDYPSFVRVECLLVFGNTTDRSTWRISEISTLIPKMLEKGHTVYGEPQDTIPRSIPYADWMKAHPEDLHRFAAPLDALEKANGGSK